MILGISLSSRTLGMAVVSGSTLVDYKVKLFKERWSNEKLDRMLSSITIYIQEHGVQKVSLVLPHKHHSNPETKHIHERCKALCKKTKLPCYCYKAQDLHQLHERTRTKKKALMQALSLLYPDLIVPQRKELANKKRYYAKLFEAVGAATLHTRDLIN